MTWPRRGYVAMWLCGGEAGYGSVLCKMGSGEYMRLYFLLSPMLFTKMANGLIGSLCDCNQLVRVQCEHSKDCSPWAWNDPELIPC